MTNIKLKLNYKIINWVIGLIFFSFSGASSSILGLKNSLEVLTNEIGANGQDVHLTQHLLNIAKYGHNLSEADKDKLRATGFDFSHTLVRLTRPGGLDESYNRGYLTFHYTVSGTDAVDSTDDDGDGVPDYVNRMADTFDEVAATNLDSLGFVRPPGDSWYSSNVDNGGSGNYDIYIFNLETGYYGYVMPEFYASGNDLTDAGDNEFSEDVGEVNAMTSYMAMRNNYYDFQGNELEIIQVTTAHEFFHAIQFGYDGWEMPWLMECTAVWMEELYYDDINDCYQYLTSWFANPELPVDDDSDRWYGSYIFISYMEENIANKDVVRLMWEASVEMDSFYGDSSIQAIDKSLIPYSSSFSEAFESMAIANGVLTSDVGAGIYSYEEADDFPVSGPVFLNDISFSDTSFTITSNSLKRYGSQYVRLTGSENEMISLDLYSHSATSNLKMNTSIVRADGSYEFFSDQELSFMLGSFDTAIVVIAALGYDSSDDFGFSLNLNVETLEVQNSQNILPDWVIFHPVYPNPFNPNTNIFFTAGNNGLVSVKVFDIKGRLIKQLLDDIILEGQYRMNWDGTDVNGETVGSGAYLIILQTESSMFVQKVVLLR